MFEPYEEDLELKIPEKEECRFVSHPKVLKVIIPLGEILVSRTALYSQSFLVNKYTGGMGNMRIQHTLSEVVNITQIIFRAAVFMNAGWY